MPSVNRQFLQMNNPHLVKSIISSFFAKRVENMGFESLIIRSGVSEVWDPLSSLSFFFVIASLLDLTQLDRQSGHFGRTKPDFQWQIRDQNNTYCCFLTCWTKNTWKAYQINLNCEKYKMRTCSFLVVLSKFWMSKHIYFQWAQDYVAHISKNTLL